MTILRPAELPAVGEDAEVGERSASRRAARLLGGGAAAWWAVTLAASLVVEGVETITVEGSLLAGLVVVAVLGVVSAFRWQLAGGIITTAAGVAFSGFALATAGRNHWFAVAVSGAPFAIAGLLFIADAMRHRPLTREHDEPGLSADAGDG